jgi:hypothetical protein
MYAVEKVSLNESQEGVTIIVINVPKINTFMCFLL